MGLLKLTKNSCTDDLTKWSKLKDSCLLKLSDKIFNYFEQISMKINSNFYGSCPDEFKKVEEMILDFVLT